MSDSQILDVAVLGAGQSGLAVAAALGRAQLQAVVLERATVGATWRGHYDRLTLNTDRLLSGLPGQPLPRRFGRWVSRDDFVGYLEDYAAELDVRTGVAATRLDRSGELWTLHGTPFRARRVVVATGRNRVAFSPAWAGRFAGSLTHSAHYRNSAAYAGQVVLVVGAGNSGAEIAADLVATGRSGAAHVLLAAKDVPGLLPRAIGPIPTQLAAFGLQAVPAPLADLATRISLEVMRPRDRGRGLPAPRALVSQARLGVLPVLDNGLRAAVHAGRVTLVAAVSALDGTRIQLADGSFVRPDAIITATGWRAGLDPLVGHLGVLGVRGLPLRHADQAAAPGLHFVGFQAALTGDVHRAGHEAAQVAAAFTGAGRLRAVVNDVRRRLPLPA